jgi:AraC-like DNA-binding protein
MGTMSQRITSVLPGAGVRIAEHAPAAALSGHVVQYWSLTVETPPATVRVLPDALVDLSFDLLHKAAWVTGPRLEPAVFTHEHPAKLFGCSLSAGSATALLGIEVGALKRDRQRLSEVLGEVADALAERVVENPLAVLDAFLLARAAAIDSRVAKALDEIVAHEGDVEIPAVGKTAGASPRNLGRLFDAWVGMSPKRFARIVRAQVALRRLADEPGIDLAALALELGFADHAHLTRELKALTGLSPSALAASLRHG